MAKRKREVEKRIRARAINTVVIAIGLGAFGAIIGLFPTIQNNFFSLLLALVALIGAVGLAVLSQIELGRIDYDEKEESGKEQSETFEGLENAIKELSRIQQEHNQLIRELLENRVDTAKASRLMETQPDQEEDEAQEPKKTGKSSSSKPSSK
jgi:hypothetical protein